MMKTKLEVGDKIQETTFLGNVYLLEVVEIKGRNAIAKDEDGYLKFKLPVHDGKRVYLSKDRGSWALVNTRPSYELITEITTK
jgi:hypothetical protein